MQAKQLKPGDRVKYVAKLGDSANSDTFAYAIVDRIDTCDNGLVWLLIGEKGYERSHPFHPSRIIEVQAKLSTQVSYRIVQTVAGRMVVTKPTDILAWAWANDRHTTFPAANLRLRPELQAQPRISGLCGPMYDGITADGFPVVRYEDSASYDVLSR